MIELTIEQKAALAVFSMIVSRLGIKYAAEAVKISNQIADEYGVPHEYVVEGFQEGGQVLENILKDSREEDNES